jgi:hypothetical protein
VYLDTLRALTERRIDRGHHSRLRASRIGKRLLVLWAFAIVGFVSGCSADVELQADVQEARSTLIDA